MNQLEAELVLAIWLLPIVLILTSSSHCFLLLDLHLIDLGFKLLDFLLHCIILSLDLFSLLLNAFLVDILVLTQYRLGD